MTLSHRKQPEKDLLDALHTELARLEPADRRICALLMEGHSEREAAALMGMPRSTFKRRWAKLRTALRKRLEPYYD